jgi:hydroxycarboxylate dehydrogenase B
VPVFTAEQLKMIGMKIFTAAGVPAGVALEVVDSLVLSNLMGVDSHGLVRVRNYLDSIKIGAIVPTAELRITADNGVAAVIDGCNAFGQIVARRATQLAIEKAREHAIGAVSFTNIYHIGRLGEYVQIAADEGFLALMFANGSRPGGLVAPFGIRERIMGTNPIAYGIPSDGHGSVIADFSTSSVSEGKVRIASRNGAKIPLGWVIDKEGNPTENPGDLYTGGAIQTFGGHKGYALSLLVEVIGGILSGADTPIFPDYRYMHNGVFLLVVNPAFFRPEQEYLGSVDFLLTKIKQALPTWGSDAALLPGDPERRQRATRERDGISMDNETWAEIIATGKILGVDVEQARQAEI